MALVADAAGAPPSPVGGPPAAGSALDKLPPVFIENRGQVDRRADFYMRGP